MASARESNHAIKILFVCSRNRRRSLTAEQIFRKVPGLDVRSAGTQPMARLLVPEGMIQWADCVLVMEKSHLQKLREKFPDALRSRQVKTLHIPDDYEYMQPDLIDELRKKVIEIVPQVERWI